MRTSNSNGEEKQRIFIKLEGHSGLSREGAEVGISHAVQKMYLKVYTIIRYISMRYN